MYICIYVYMYICIYVYMYICIYVYVYMCICVYVYMCICVCICNINNQPKPLPLHLFSIFTPCLMGESIYKGIAQVDTSAAPILGVVGTSPPGFTSGDSLIQNRRSRRSQGFIINPSPFRHRSCQTTRVSFPSSLESSRWNNWSNDRTSPNSNILQSSAYKKNPLRVVSPMTSPHNLHGTQTVRNWSS